MEERNEHEFHVEKIEGLNTGNNIEELNLLQLRKLKNRKTE